MLTIHNIRTGFANNSSSSHSIIFLDPKDKDLAREWAIKDSGGDCGDFGWNHFVLDTTSKKLHYLARTIFHNLEETIGERNATIVAEKLMNSKLHEGGYIDHDSIMLIPLKFGTKDLNEEFIRELTSIIAKDNVVILGGNDNEPNPDNFPSGPSAIPNLPFDGSNQITYARKDKNGNYWSLYNKKNGNKIRFSFDTNATAPTHTTAPELVDICITGFCPIGCEFCYQGSTVNGKHCDSGYIRTIIYKLAELQVFEIAFGGGEPTMHPDFVDIIVSCYYSGITANFTTKSFHWLNDHKIREKVLKHCGSFAFSISSNREMMKLISIAEMYNIEPSKFSIQLVMGSLYQHDFENILSIARLAHIRVTLLGFKTTKRGKGYDQIKCDWWIDAVKNGRFSNIGIDTVLAKQYEQKLIEEKVHPKTYHTEDGTFSCYIDAVEKKLKPSSYDEDFVGIDISDVYKTNEKILAAFANRWR